MDNFKEYRSVMSRIGIVLVLNTLLLQGLSLAADALYGRFGGPLTAAVADLGMGMEAAEYVLTQLINGAIYLFSFMFPVAVFRMLSRRRPSEVMRLGVRVPKETPLLVIASIGLILGAAYLNSLLMSAFDFSSLFEEEEMTKSYQFIISFITTALIPGFCEEFLFRGCVCSNMLPYGRTAAILGSAAAFALMHGNTAQYLYTFCAGVILALLYEETGSIWPGTIVHVCNNFFSVIEEFVYDSGKGDLFLMLFELAFFFAAAAALVWLILLRKGKLFTSPVGAAEPSYSVRLERTGLLRGYFNAWMIIFAVLSLLEAGMFLILALPTYY